MKPTHGPSLPPLKVFIEAQPNADVAQAGEQTNEQAILGEGWRGAGIQNVSWGGMEGQSLRDLKKWCRRSTKTLPFMFCFYPCSYLLALLDYLVGNRRQLHAAPHWGGNMQPQYVTTLDGEDHRKAEIGF